MSAARKALESVLELAERPANVGDGPPWATREQDIAAIARAGLRAPAGGIDLYDHHYLGGEFLPFYVPRPAMPQVDEKDLPRLVADAMSGPRVEFDVIEVCKLRAHQRINHDLSRAMDARVKLKPVIVSGDNYIVDGNHRWWAHVHAGDEWINVIRLGLSFDIAIRWVLTRPYAYRLTPDTPVRN